jgi:SP family galactose:H+ symporter-like MFS transporter
MLIAVMTACGGLLFGYDVGVISGALLFLGKKFELSDQGQEVVTSAVLVGSFLGALGAGWYTRRFGGRSANMLAGAIFVVGAFASAASGSAETLTMSRLLVGLGIGITAVAAPLYVGEIAPPDRRGLMITLYQLFITIGILVSYIVDLAAAPHWRIMFGLGAVPGVVLAVGMSFMPSSPRWLASRGRMDEAKKVLDRTLEPSMAERALRDIQNDLESQKGLPHWWLAFRTRAARRALVITTTLAVLQQFIGINAIIYYAPRIFQKAGFADAKAALWATLVVGVVNVVATFITMGMVDKSGRRTLLIWGLTGMVASLGVLGIAFKQFDHADAQQTAQLSSAQNAQYSSAQSAEKTARIAAQRVATDPAPPHNLEAATPTDAPTDVASPRDLPSTSQGAETLAWLTLVCVIVYIACFAFSMGPLVWVLIGEMFPLQARGSGNAIACGGNYFANFIVGATFLTLLTKLGASNTFLIFASVAMFTLLFVLFFLPETAGRTLEEIEQDLGEKIPTAR